MIETEWAGAPVVNWPSIDVDPAGAMLIKIESERPRNPYATGYGAKVPLRYRVRIHGHWYRLYVMIYGNSVGRPYVTIRSTLTYVSDDVWQECTRRAARGTVNR